MMRGTKHNVKAGDVFGNLTVASNYVLDSSKPRSERYLVSCICARCNDECVADIYNLIGGKTKSCRKCHHHGGMTGTAGLDSRICRIWKGIKNRCFNPNVPAYKDYGGRGITMCEEWNEFRAFRAWANSSGYEHHLTIDRIDNNGNYEPSNCRWVTYKQNNRNRRSNVRLTAFGETKILTEWAEDNRCVVSQPALQHRLKSGWTLERALLTAPRQQRKSAGVN